MLKKNICKLRILFIEVKAKKEKSFTDKSERTHWNQICITKGDKGSSLGRRKIIQDGSTQRNDRYKSKYKSFFSHMHFNRLLSA